jgi:hypothetical protein
VAGNGDSGMFVDEGGGRNLYSLTLSIDMVKNRRRAACVCCVWPGIVQTVHMQHGSSSSWLELVVAVVRNCMGTGLMFSSV